MKQFINDKYFRFIVAVEIIITIIITTNNKYMRSSLRAFASMINLF